MTQTAPVSFLWKNAEQRSLHLSPVGGSCCWSGRLYPCALFWQSIRPTSYGALPNLTLQSLNRTQVADSYRIHVAEPYLTQFAEPYWTHVAQPYQISRCRALTKYKLQSLIEHTLQSLTKQVAHPYQISRCRALNKYKLQSLTKPHVVEP